MTIYGFAAEQRDGVLLIWPAYRRNGRVTCYSSIEGRWQPAALIWFEPCPPGRPRDPASLRRCERLAEEALASRHRRRTG